MRRHNQSRAIEIAHEISTGSAWRNLRKAFHLGYTAGGQIYGKINTLVICHSDLHKFPGIALFVKDEGIGATFDGTMEVAHRMCGHIRIADVVVQHADGHTLYR